MTRIRKLPIRGRMPAAVARGVLTDDELADLRERNAARAAELIQQMGPKHLLHPANSPRRIHARYRA